MDVEHNYVSFFFFFNDTATTEIYTLSLHDALPICYCKEASVMEKCNKRVLKISVFMILFYSFVCLIQVSNPLVSASRTDRKSTRLNSSHANISYAVFCLKKKQNIDTASL